MDIGSQLDVNGIAKRLNVSYLHTLFTISEYVCIQLNTL
jgi:hypothetical protein